MMNIEHTLSAVSGTYHESSAHVVQFQVLIMTHQHLNSKVTGTDHEAHVECKNVIAISTRAQSCTLKSDNLFKSS